MQDNSLVETLRGQLITLRSQIENDQVHHVYSNDEFPFSKQEEKKTSLGIFQRFLKSNFNSPNDYIMFLSSSAGFALDFQGFSNAKKVASETQVELKRKVVELLEKKEDPKPVLNESLDKVYDSYKKCLALGVQRHLCDTISNSMTSSSSDKSEPVKSTPQTAVNGATIEKSNVSEIVNQVATETDNNTEEESRKIMEIYEKEVEIKSNVIISTAMVSIMIRGVYDIASLHKKVSDCVKVYTETHANYKSILDNTKMDLLFIIDDVLDFMDKKTWEHYKRFIRNIESVERCLEKEILSMKNEISKCQSHQRTAIFSGIEGSVSLISNIYTGIKFWESMTSWTRALTLGSVLVSSGKLYQSVQSYNVLQDLIGSYEESSESFKNYKQSCIQLRDIVDKLN
ncbi:hypothetical protein NAEGRDRAFT_79065 [Naegleria gruberi]|uniref:Uncharacterized protein n=1 Tax=Naegleria gruberi TaxID=5762 RepID=D2V9G1_NAEGR|nr:uncharacterized protein NAEGRDRAFT_79065 [Naegleria gruberi]EFC46585.1 hypothetical protein NAEGRDRAFT_79065 [Naegleria gruberi]|eukprot:XP_002679329.1 hypothetical protein NAEGRDRAFT_79065 [Naegleria gruberi strain NEG-M]